MIRGHVAVLSRDSPSPDVRRVISSCRKATIRLVLDRNTREFSINIESTDYCFKVPGNIRTVDKCNIASGLVRVGFIVPDLDIVIYGNPGDLETFVYTMKALEEPSLPAPNCSDGTHKQKFSCICRGPKFSHNQRCHYNSVECPFSVYRERLCAFCCYSLLESYNDDDARKVINIWKSEIENYGVWPTIDINTVSVTLHPYLRRLTACFLGLVEIPEKLGSLPCLVYLNLSFNRLGQATNWNWLASPFLRENLHELNLEKNYLTTVPEPVVRLRNLETLLLNGNHLTELPSALGNLKHLSKLDISYNNLKIIPGWIYHRKHFFQLYIGKNYLLLHFPEFAKPQLTPKDFDVSVSSLFETVAKYIITERLAYWEHNIPSRIAESLDGAYICPCGSVVFPDTVGRIIRCQIETRALTTYYLPPDLCIDIHCCSYRCYRLIKQYMI